MLRPAFPRSVSTGIHDGIDHDFRLVMATIGIIDDVCPLSALLRGAARSVVRTFRLIDYDVFHGRFRQSYIDGGSVGGGSPFGRLGGRLGWRGLLDLAERVRKPDDRQDEEREECENPEPF